MTTQMHGQADYSNGQNRGPEATAEQAKQYPIINPYTTDLDELEQMRLKASEPRKRFNYAVKHGKIEPPNDLAAYVLLGEKRPDLVKQAFENADFVAKTWDHDTVQEVLKPVYDRFIHNIQHDTTDMPFDPMIKNAYDTYCEQERFEAEVRALETSFLIGCCGGDVSKGRYFQNTMNFKKVLIVHDGQRFRAFDNTARDVPVSTPEEWYATGELADITSDVKSMIGKMTELPCGEKCGIVLVLTHPEHLPAEEATKAALDEKLANVFNAKLQKELSAYGIGQCRAVVLQQIAVNGNWKLAVDTFGESYHFHTLHATTLRDTFVCNRQVFRSFDDDRDGSPGNCSMGLGRFTLKLCADGIMPSNGPGTLLNHIIPTFGLAYNTVFFPLSTGGVFMSQIWPGKEPGKCMTTLGTMGTRLPADPKAAVGGFGGLLDIFATEDFKILPLMQRNFQQNRHAETIFGRHEPILTYRHRAFQKLAELGGYKKHQTMTTRARL